MILITEVAEKLQTILNNAYNPTGLYFRVETEGFHIDHIKAPFNGEETKNFIPVFIYSMGGQYNPVKGLKQGNYTFGIAFYFPVSFKEQMFALNEYLVDAFVGEVINYGPISGKAVSNISVAQFGELVGVDFEQFRVWCSNLYQKPIDVMDTYMSMNISLYLSNAADGLLYGNDIKTSLSFTYDDKTYTLSEVDIDGASLQSNSQAQSEQEENALTPESDSLPFGTTYGASFKIYPNLNAQAEEAVSYSQESGTYDPNAIYYRKSGDDFIEIGQISEATYNGYHSASITLYVSDGYYYFYQELLKIWLAGNIQDLECQLTYTIGDPSYGLVFTRKCYIQSIVAPIEKGQLFALTLTFAKKVEFDEE